MTEVFISIGKITTTFGLKGLLKVISRGDVLSSLQLNTMVYLYSGVEYTPYKLLTLRQNKKLFIVSLEGFDSIEKSAKLIGEVIYIPKIAIESLLEKDEYFVHQLIGLHPHCKDTIYSEFSLLEVLENPVHPILLFSDGKVEILIPYINQFVGNIDITNSKMEILNWEDWLIAD